MIRMATLLRFPFLTSFVMCALPMIGIYFGQNYWAAVLVLFAHPIVDSLVGRKAPIRFTANNRFFNFFLMFSVLSVYLIWFYCFYFFLKASTFSDSLVIASACGLMMGFLGITTAHELVHRPEGPLKWAGFATLWVLNYGHWGVEHVFGHHKNVATPLDPVSARKNENIYFYLVRAIGGSFVHSLDFEKNKSLLKRKVHLSLFIQLVMNGVIFALWGVNGLVFHWIQSLIAITLLESVEYIEHYGLFRKKMDNGLFEPVNENHSWDCEHYLTNAALINLGYHSHHHQKPMVPYQDLPNKLGARVMPWGYSLMILIAFIPPLFFKLINPRLQSTNS